MSLKKLSKLGLFLAPLALGALIFWWGNLDDPPPQTPSTSSEDTPALAGRVVDTSGRPVSAANVFAGDAHARADHDGYFAFPELPAKQLPVDVTADGYLRAGVGPLGRPVFDLRDGTPLLDITLVIGRVATIEGQIVAGATPVAEATINLHYLFADSLDGSPLKPHIVSQVATTDREGYFHIPALAPGRLQVMVESQDHPFTESREMFLRPGRHIQDLIIDMAPTATLAGQVLSQWGDALQAQVILTPLTAGTRPIPAQTNQDGRFFFDRLEAGNYRLEVTAPQFRPQTIQPLHIAGHEVDDMELILEQRRGYFGRVFDDQGQPVSRAFVNFHAEGDQFVHRLLTDAQGRFEWSGHDHPSPLWISADSPGHQSSGTKQARLDQEMTLEIASGGRVIGRVIDPSGRPVTDFNLGVSFAEFDDDARYNTRQLPRGTLSDDQGYFELGPLRSGRYRLMVETDQFPPARTDALRVNPGDTVGPITIQLEAPASLSGVIRDAQTDQPVPHAQVIFALSTPSNRQPRAYADDQGRYELTDLPSGRGSLRVVHDMYVFEHVGGIELQARRDNTLDIALEPLGDGPPGQSMQGIGTALSRVDQGYRVGRVFPDSPAARAGIVEGDIITAVGSQAVQQMTMDQVVELIRGRPGTTVTLQIQRDRRGSRTVVVERDRVFMEQDRVVRGRLE